MATDSFTAANGTALGAHTAGGNTWVGLNFAEPVGAILNNVACADGEEFAFVQCRASNSTADFCQIVFKAGAYLDESKAVHVRSGAASNGYVLRVFTVVGGNITSFALYRHEATLTTVEGVSIPTNVDHTVALKATTVGGGNVEIRAWLDGTPLTFSDTSSGDATSSQVYTDLSANTPITSGNPGFSCGYYDGIGSTNSGFDDWTDVESGGSSFSITSIADATLTHGQTGIVVNVSGYAASGKTVKICPTPDVNDASGVLQTVMAQDASSVTFTAVLNSFAFGTTLYVFVLDGGSAASANADGEPVSRIIASATLNFTGSNKFIDENGVPAEISGLTFHVWRAPRPTGSAPDQIFASQSTDENGEISLSLDLGSLDDGDSVFFLVFGADGTDVFSAGEQVPDYA